MSDTQGVDSRAAHSDFEGDPDPEPALARGLGEPARLCYESRSRVHERSVPFSNAARSGGN